MLEKRLLVLALLVSGCGVEPVIEEPVRTAVGRALPGPAPQLRAEGYDAVAENAACERCHTEIAAEWRASLHRSAWDDPVFLSAYAMEPLAFCRDCHAPEAATNRSDDPARHAGVGCVTCHVLASDVLGTRTLADAPGAHAVTAAREMATADWCSGCHQFDFPEPQEAAMQSTVAEHAASKFADRSCQDCHMPAVAATGGRGRAHRDHSFRVHGDPALIRAAVSAYASRNGDRTVTVTLRVDRAGHAVPTGDMFRRLEVLAEATDVDGAVAARPVVLARSFRREKTPDGDRRVQIGDTRLPADGEPREAELIFPRAIDASTVRWRVVYRRMGPHEAALFGVDVAAEEVEVAAGRLDPEPVRESRSP